MEAREERPLVKNNKRPLSREERMQKREKRKQSNRESAKRSRQPKQLQRTYLKVQVEELTYENNYLREELKMLSGNCEKLASENVSLKRLKHVKHLGPEKVPEDNDDPQSLADEGNN